MIKKDAWVVAKHEMILLWPRIAFLSGFISGSMPNDVHKRIPLLCTLMYVTDIIFVTNKNTYTYTETHTRENI